MAFSMQRAYGADAKHPNGLVSRTMSAMFGGRTHAKKCPKRQAHLGTKCWPILIAPNAIYPDADAWVMELRRGRKHSRTSSFPMPFATMGPHSHCVQRLKMWVFLYMHMSGASDDMIWEWACCLCAMSSISFMAGYIPFYGCSDKMCENVT